MTFSEIVEAHGGQAGLAKALGCNKSYICRAAQRGEPGMALAIRIYRQTGHKLGPLVDATPKQIEALERISVRSVA